MSKAFFWNSNLNRPSGVQGWELVDRLAGSWRGVLATEDTDIQGKLRSLSQKSNSSITEVTEDEFEDLRKKKLRQPETSSPSNPRSPQEARGVAIKSRAAPAVSANSPSPAEPTVVSDNIDSLFKLAKIEPPPGDRVEMKKKRGRPPKARP